MKTKTGTVTSVQLAELCGVSQGTVDRALNDRPGISPKTKERILKAAEEHGYIKNMNASFLSSGKAKLLGLVVFNFNNEFFAQLAAAVEKRARELGYSVMMAVSNTDIAEEKRAVERMLSFGVDGVLLCPVSFGEEYDEMLCRYNKPIITVSNKAGENIPFVGANEYEAMQEMTEHVLSEGYKNTALYIPPMRYLGETNIYAQRLRAEGYKNTVSKCGGSAQIFISEDDVINYVKNSSEKTAVLCASDIYALKLLKRFQKAGVKVPQDVGLTGFDNISSLDFFAKRLTTVNYPISEIGEAAAEQLINIIEDKQTEMPVCKCGLVPGETL